VNKPYKLLRDNFYLLKQEGYSELEIAQRLEDFDPIPGLEDMLEEMFVEMLMAQKRYGKLINDDIEGWNVSDKTITTLTDAGHKKQDVLKIAYEWKTILLLQPNLIIVHINKAFINYFTKINSHSL
jgi:hypothetical protein